MPILSLPALSPAVSVPSTAAGEAALTPGPLQKDLSQQALSPLEQTSLRAKNSANEILPSPFMETFRQQLDMPLLPQGQELASVMPGLTKQHEAANWTNSVDGIPEELIDGLNANMIAPEDVQPNTLTSLTPFSDAPQNKATTDADGFDMQDLMQQRNAKVQLQSGKQRDGELAQQSTLTEKPSAMLAPAVNIKEQEIRPAVLTEGMQKASEPVAPTLLTGSSVSPDGKPLTSAPKPMEAHLNPSVIDSLAETDNTSIHEKPLTLSAKPILETAMQSVMAAETQSGDAEVPESLQVNQQLSATKLASGKQEAGVASQNEISPGEKAAQAKLNVPPSNPQWSEQISKRISMMASEGLQTARIQLDPPELGSLEIKIKVQQDQVSVSFASNNGQVRDVLDSQSARLRELMEQQGINLADVNVSEQGQQQTGNQQEGQGLADGEAGSGISPDEQMQESATTVIESDSLVDYFA